MRIPAHSVCTAIRDDIVSGVYERGGRLTEEVLARRYGVSRVPVREALRTLEAEGFVVTRRHAGACVAEPTTQEAADQLEIRMLLEPLAAARAAQRRTEAHLKVLRGLVRLGQERSRRGQSEDLRSLGGWFHETLAQTSGSPGLITMLTQLRHKIAWMYTVEQPAQPAASWAEHGAIVDAVARGDVERARALTAQHTERAMAAHSLRAPHKGGRVRTSQHPVNTAGLQH
ncbi:GntR family transcriptional regulator [Streptomyces sp. NPDC055059]|jgi:DNA-binding GntR family transcriptional regulator|uniref:GntR family transcriptional regulator n=1 Tax=Streptomyces sp. NBC_00119 TaxID=2975659 RepID=A0AAU1U594_9ACTN|nr:MULTISPECIES: GntR family transcriptional regulator [unclassified Streptomyces]MCX4642624.1 GntR family transcriptional regulator [Streptomyces sp. NBC_01446]MCX5327565.1 GntR family transcriptional regulator [Streptomyces sp. NBC_00120]